MVTFIYPADITTGKGDGGESIYGPTFEGMFPQLSHCENGKFPQKSSCLPDLIHKITWESFRFPKAKAFAFQSESLSACISMSRLL